MAEDAVLKLNTELQQTRATANQVLQRILQIPNGQGGISAFASQLATHGNGHAAGAGGIGAATSSAMGALPSFLPMPPGLSAGGGAAAAAGHLPGSGALGSGMGGRDLAGIGGGGVTGGVSLLGMKRGFDQVLKAEQQQQQIEGGGDVRGVEMLEGSLAKRQALDAAAAAAVLAAVGGMGPNGGGGAAAAAGSPPRGGAAVAAAVPLGQGGGALAGAVAELEAAAVAVNGLGMQPELEVANGGFRDA